MSPMNNRRMTPMAEPGVLDFAPGAAAAYSLRSLSNSYAGPVVTVRRSTDDAEADFTASEVSDGTLAAWVGGGNDGFVKQWWDQSGNARHATASGTAQPQIVDSGVLATEGGKAALSFDGSDDYLQVPVHAVRLSENPASVFFVSSVPSLSVDNYLLSEADSLAPSYSSNFIFGGGGTAGGAQSLWVNLTTFGIMRTGLAASSFIYDGAIFRCFLDGLQQGVSGAATINAEVGTGTVIGSRGDGTTSFLLGTISEILIYRKDQTALSDRITGNQMWYY